jgi:curli biogenesis system outer membrane secretion channel CsgG
MSHLPRLMLRFQVLALSILAVTGLAAAEGGQATLAVLPLRGGFQVPNPNRNFPGQGQMAARPAQGQAGPTRMGQIQPQILSRVTMAFLKTGRFQLVERAQLDAVLKEGKFEQSGLVDDATAAKLGKQMGATFVLVGSFTGSIGHTAEVTSHFFGGKTREDSYPGHLEVRLNLVNTEDGSIREAFLFHASSQDPKAYHAYELLLDDLTANLEKETALRFPLTGYVIKVISEREALVDLGRRQRLEKGASFQLVEQGPDVVHPVTGKLIQGERRVLTQLQVTDVGEESSILKVTGDRATLKVGQSVVQAR